MLVAYTQTVSYQLPTHKQSLTSYLHTNSQLPVTYTNNQLVIMLVAYTQTVSH